MLDKYFELAKLPSLVIGQISNARLITPMHFGLSPTQLIMCHRHLRNMLICSVLCVLFPVFVYFLYVMGSINFYICLFCLLRVGRGSNFLT